MFSRRLLTTARMASLRRPMQQPLRGVPLPAMMSQVRTYADALVKVPQMAESITEGTLKQWNKQVGDYVAQDEEIATIETDKASTSPLPAGTIPRPGARGPCGRAARRGPGTVTNRPLLYRSMWPSTPPRAASSRSSWPTRTTP